MKFDEVLAKARKVAEKVTVSDGDFMAVQVNLSGDEGGTFYVEVKDGKVSVEPYEYNDRQCQVTVDAATLTKIMDGKANAVMAYTTGKLKVDGDVGAALKFSELIKKK